MWPEKNMFRMNIPLPKAGHWQKLRFGKKAQPKHFQKTIPEMRK